MWYNSKVMTTGLAFAILLLTVLSIMDGSFMSASKLDKYSKQLFEYTLPENTIKLEEYSIYGKPDGGNGNYLDFLAAIVIKSDLPIDKLQEYYSGIPLKKAIETKNIGYEPEVIISEQTSENFEPERFSRFEYGKDKVVFNSLKNVTDFSGYYIVIIYDGGYSRLF